MSTHHTQTNSHNVTSTDFDIIQIGYGPVSKVSALLLERMGWKVGIFGVSTEFGPYRAVRNFVEF